MLTDVALKRLKPKEKDYKVTDRDGMYVLVKRTGVLTFRYDYRLHGRRETLTIGRYGLDGVSLADAREECLAARRLVAKKLSPAHERKREKRRLKEEFSFGALASLASAKIAPNTLAELGRDTLARFALGVFADLPAAADAG